MPRELIAYAPQTPVLREYTENPLEPTQIFQAWHGAGRLPQRSGRKSTLRCNARGSDAETLRGALRGFPRALCNMTAGSVIEIGNNVTRFSVSDRVFGYVPIHEAQTVDESKDFPVQMNPDLRMVDEVKKV